MKLAIKESTGEDWLDDLVFVLEEDSCLDIFSGKELIGRICDVEDFIALAEGIKQYYRNSKEQDGE